MKEQSNKTPIDYYFGAITKEEIAVLKAEAPDVSIEEFVRLQLAVLAWTETPRTLRPRGGGTPYRVVRHADGILKDASLHMARHMIARCVARYLACGVEGRMLSHRALGKGHATYLLPVIHQAEQLLARSVQCVP